MPRYAYQSHFVDGNGTIVPDGTVTVYLTGTSTLATIYESATGVAVSSSQITTDSDDGSFKFFVDSKDYNATQNFRITLAKTNFRSQTYDDIVIFPDTTYRYVVDAGETDQGAVGNGFSLKDLIDDIGSNSETIYAPAGNYTLTTSETIPSNITFKPSDGAVFDGAGTLTIAKEPVAGHYKIFGSSITVSFSTNMVVKAAWFGVTNDGVDSSTAMQACCDSAPDAASDAWGNETSHEIVLQGGSINFEGDISPKGGTWIHGRGWSTKITGSSLTNGVFYCNAIGGTGTRFSDFLIQNTEGSSDKYDFYLYNSNGIFIDNVWLAGARGVALHGSTDVTIRNNVFDLGSANISHKTGTTCFKVAIYNNLFHKWSTSCITLNGAISCVVTDNQFTWGNSEITVNPAIQINGDYGTIVRNNTFTAGGTTATSTSKAQAQASSHVCIYLGVGTLGPDAAHLAYSAASACVGTKITGNSILPNEKYLYASDSVAMGTHDAATHATIMTDSGESFTVDALIGRTIRNITDGSSGVITDNDGTTITVSALTGGTDNQWENGDEYAFERANGWYRGIHCKDLTNGLIANNFIDGCLESIRLTGTGSGLITGNNIRGDNDITTNTVTTYSIYSTSDDPSANWDVVGNRFQGCNNNNAAQWSGGEIIFNSGTDWHISGNRFVASTNSYAAVGLATGATGCVVENNFYDGVFPTPVAKQTSTNANIIKDTTTSSDLGAGNQTMTTNQLLGGIIDTDPEGAANWTTPAASSMVTIWPNAQVGQTIECVLHNNATGASAEVVTILAGPGVTLHGSTVTLTEGTNETAKLLFVFTNVTAASEAVDCFIFTGI